ncbi:MAG: hypothetical protein V4605_09555 [Pseudomonadota bacterium]
MSALQTKIHRHHDGQGTITVESVQDCNAIIESITRQKTEGKTGSADMKLAARLPNVIVETYLNLNNISFSEFMGNQEHIKRILNDPALSKFRVWEGQV